MVQLFIEEELVFSGREGDLSKYMAVKGMVFDITSRKELHGGQAPSIALTKKDQRGNQDALGACRCHP